MKVVLFVVVSFIALTGWSQAITDHYKIYDTRQKKIISLQEMAEGVRDANVVFFGEEHNDSIGHYLEAELARALYALHGERLTISMEMFETDCQLVLNEYLAGYISEERFSKEARIWNNYKDYKPIVELAKTNKLDVIAANPPRRYVNMVSRKGMRSLDSLPKDSKKFLPPLPYDTLGGRYREKFLGFMQGGSPGTNNFRIYYSQSLWDAGMSYSIYKYWKKHRDQKILHFVGRFHSDEKLGTAEQLQMRSSKLRIMNISSFSDESFGNPDWEKFSVLGDYVIITDPTVKKTF
ncbi:MAG TPA: ChaN family lipoprotein [Chitinophagaceae bacterium]|jgi:uncharacterized iron-regulated protein|nr:ChaN family lipoprotein [Chitinophagaceae bacterium]